MINLHHTTLPLAIPTHEIALVRVAALYLHLQTYSIEGDASSASA